MKQELLPCPWCGSKARSWPHGDSILVCCDAQCEQSQEHSVYGMFSKDWNTRAPDARVQLLAKALREAREEALYWFKNANPKLPTQEREPAGWVRVVDNIDAALKEAELEG